MWNNKEIRNLVYAAILETILIVFLSFCVPLSTGIWILIEGIALSFLYVCFTRIRYQNIKRLSEYLQAVYTGSKAMDIQDHEEGELSILKSDIYKITSILKQQSASLKKDKTYLADALSNISHQLKTPLTGMLVMSELLQDEDLPAEKRKEFMTQIQAQLKRIEWLVTTLLKISKIDASAIVFHKEKILLKEVLLNAVASISIPMEIKEQQLLLDCEESIWIDADRNWCIEAFVNILKNCMEHTFEKGRIAIRCEDNPLQTIVWVQDDGCGIDASDLPHIFERFYKGKNASNDSVGIGLSLSKLILLELNADIEVSSEPDQGTSFCIRFYK